MLLHAKVQGFGMEVVQVPSTGKWTLEVTHEYNDCSNSTIIKII